MSFRSRARIGGRQQADRCNTVRRIAGLAGKANPVQKQRMKMGIGSQFGEGARDDGHRPGFTLGMIPSMPCRNCDGENVVHLTQMAAIKGKLAAPSFMRRPMQLGQKPRPLQLKALKRETIEIQGDGSQIRAWCHIDDLVRGIGLAITSPKPVGETFNLGNARSIGTICGLGNTIGKIILVVVTLNRTIFSPGCKPGAAPADTVMKPDCTPIRMELQDR